MRKPRQIINYGHQALLLEWQQQIDPLINDSVHAYAQMCLIVAGVKEAVPAYCSLLVYFDPAVTDAYHLREQLYAMQVESKPLSGQVHRLPVCYGGDFGPDLEEVAERLSLKVSKLIKLHQDSTYRVYQLGYQPGFAFLGLTDPALGIERRKTPRARVAAGSVGLAGRQTGIYPEEYPGGWQIIGRCPWPMMEVKEDSLTRLQAGDQVQFFAIKPEEWAKYEEKPEPWTV